MKISSIYFVALNFALLASSTAQTGTPLAADFSSATNQRWMNQIRVDGINLLRGSGFHIIGSLGTADNNNNVASESSQNSNGIMRPYEGTAGGSVPYSLTFSRNTGDASKIAFSVSVGPSASSFQVMNIPLEANLSYFSYWRHSAASGVWRYDQIGNGTPSYSNPHGNYYIAGASGSPTWGEMIGRDYTLRVSINSSNTPVSLAFVNAPQLGGGIRDVEFGFTGGLPRNTVKTVSGFIQVLRTNTSSLPQRTYEAEASNYFQIGVRNGDGRSATAAQKGYLQYGPYLRVDPIEAVRNTSPNLVAGFRRASFRLLVDNNSANDNKLLTLDVYDANTGQTLKRTDITRRMFSAANNYSSFALDFNCSAGQLLEFRVFSYGGSFVKLDKVTLN